MFGDEGLVAIEAGGGVAEGEEGLGFVVGDDLVGRVGDGERALELTGQAHQRDGGCLGEDFADLLSDLGDAIPLLGDDEVPAGFNGVIESNASIARSEPMLSGACGPSAMVGVAVVALQRFGGPTVHPHRVVLELDEQGEIREPVKDPLPVRRVGIVRDQFREF